MIKDYNCIGKCLSANLSIIFAQREGLEFIRVLFSFLWYNNVRHVSVSPFISSILLKRPSAQGRFSLYKNNFTIQVSLLLTYRFRYSIVLIEGGHNMSKKRMLVPKKIVFNGGSSKVTLNQMQLAECGIEKDGNVITYVVGDEIRIKKA